MIVILICSLFDYKFTSFGLLIIMNLIHYSLNGSYYFIYSSKKSSAANYSLMWAKRMENIDRTAHGRTALEPKMCGVILTKSVRSAEYRKITEIYMLTLRVMDLHPSVLVFSWRPNLYSMHKLNTHYSVCSSGLDALMLKAY